MRVHYAKIALSTQLSEAQAIGMRVRLARTATLLSQAQLAQRIHVSEDAVGRIERGECVPDALLCAAIAVALGQEFKLFDLADPDLSGQR